MNRLPIIPTLIVAAAIAVMIGLGVWQLQRAEWKERMLAELEAAPSQPAIDLDPLLGSGKPPANFAFRRALISCTVRDVAPSLRAGRTLDGQSGFSVFVPCRPGADGWPGRIEVNAGWTRQADYRAPVTLAGITAGSIGTVEPDGPIILTAATPAPGLIASAAPAIADIPNNHLMYAGQWFFFAFTAALIFVLALRRRRRPDAEKPPHDPAEFRAVFGRKQLETAQGLLGDVIEGVVLDEWPLFEREGRPVYEHPDIRFVQAQRLELQMRSGHKFQVGTFQDDDCFALMLERGEPHSPFRKDGDSASSYSRFRVFAEFPVGSVHAVEPKFDPPGNITELWITIGERVVILKAGEVYEESGGLTVRSEDESVLIFASVADYERTKFYPETYLSIE